VNLTDRTIRSLKPAEKRTTYYDESLVGFGVRVTPSGRKTFTFRYRGDDMRQRRVTIGTYPAITLAQARKKARALLGEVARGDDPAAEVAARKTAVTFGELADLYMDRHAKARKRSWRYDQRMLDLDLLPAWKKRRANEIRRVDVIDVLDGIVDRGSPYAANRVRALASKVFAFGLARGIVDLNPVAGVPRPASPRSRDRVLTEEEIRCLWTALDDESPHMAAHFRLRVLTAQRGIEVLSMRWQDIEGDTWTVPANVSKNKLAHRVPLSVPARSVLETLRPLSDGSPWVFPSPRGDGHLKWVNKAARDIRDRVSFEWVPHDLRRTAATFMGSMGVERTVLGKILNHAETGVTATYDRASYDHDKRRALVAWGDKVERIVSGKKEEKVVGRIG